MRKIITLFTIVFTTLLISACGDSNEVRIIFDENYPGFTTSVALIEKKGSKISKPSDPERDGYTFLGWYLNDELYDFEKELTKDITLLARWRAVLDLTGEATGLVGDYIVLNIEAAGEKLEGRTLNWTSSDTEVATVVGGVVTLLKQGTTTITVENDGSVETIEITVENRNAQHLMDYFTATSKDVIERQTINYVGSDDGSNDYKHNLFPSVLDYRFNDPIEMNVRLLGDDENYHENYANKPLISLEWIVVHDTANTNAGAEANHNWIFNSSNPTTSWHYTVGTDGWYKALHDLEVGNQAFDGTDAPAGFTDTGIPATVIRPKMEISADGYFVILGEKTKVKAPLVNGNLPKTSDITEAGIWPVVIDGTYHIPTARYTTSYKSAIVITGGHMNGIGIETSVLRSTDIWVTWHRTAKLVAELLIKHNLSFDRVTFHNHFANKPCPRTAMESDNWDNWIALMEFEYHVLKYYSDYIIEFETLTPDILDNTGRIANAVKSNSTAEYKLTITSPDGEKIEKTFEVLVHPRD